MSSIITSTVSVVGESWADVAVAVAQLGDVGFCDAQGMMSLSSAEEYLKLNRPELLFVDDTWEGECGRGMAFIRRVTRANPMIDFVLLTSDPSVEQFCMGAFTGLVDYLYKSSELDVGEEAIRILAMQQISSRRRSPFNCLRDLGIFRTLGLTIGEIEILEHYMADFPRQKELSRRVGKSEVQMRKMFSSIYKKLSGTISVENPAQLARLLTIAGLFKATKGVPLL